MSTPAPVEVPASAFFFGFLGSACAVVFACLGSAYGTTKSAVGAMTVGVMRPELIMRAIVPCIMAGAIGLYGLIVSIIMSFNITATGYTAYRGFAHLAGGLSVGLVGLGAGMAIGIVGDSGIRAYAQQPQLFTSLILVLIFAEALALYGVIAGILLTIK